jgi:hypothetical protein
MTAKIIPFLDAKLERLSPVDQAAQDALAANYDIMSYDVADRDAVSATIDQLEKIDHDLQVQAHAINLQIGEVRRRRLSLLKVIGTPRWA